MSSINVIGGSGFIGTELLKELSNESLPVRNVDKRQSSLYPSITTLADICDKAELQTRSPETDYTDDWVVLLAAEHRDDVSPRSLYYSVNVEGTRNILEWMDKRKVSKIIFTSSVAVYGLNKDNPDESHAADPFNDYGKSKWQAEEVLREWYSRDPGNRTLIIIRPTVVFGPGNRGNVYNLLQKIASGRFLMIGNGENRKSMAFVSNLVGFIKFCINKDFKGYYLYNYADKPDLSTNELVSVAEQSVNGRISKIRIPYFVGYMGGLAFDLAARVLRRKFVISAVRVKKFCATTQFSSDTVAKSEYKPPFSLSDGLHLTISSILSAATSLSAGVTVTEENDGDE